ncbi:nose resistant to fluoxetine protein 6-like [Haematobia irritans]|uniref:nose resistant to fluoxetine protein 6-like n=1 Tax=Haematobia irritans TaxID=7368 RepID=UPI003F509324
MPLLYEMDDYKACMQQPSNTYCLIYMEIRSDNDSTLLHEIKKHYNASVFHFRYDQLYRGMCTSNIKRNLKSIATHQQASDYRATLLETDNMQWNRKLFKISQNQKSISQYHHLIHTHLDSEMQNKFNVSVKTFVRYCENPEEPIEKGFGYSFTLYLLITIVGLNLFSTIYDFHAKSRNTENAKNHNYYDKDHKTNGKKLLTAFSLVRNYRRIVAPNVSTVGKDLSFIDGVRTLLSFTIVCEHLVFTIAMPISNSSSVENFYTKALPRWLLNMMVCIEIFFLLSGLFLSIKFHKNEYVTAKTSMKECFYIYMRMMISRYLRYIPSLLLLIVVSANTYIHLHNGPLWRNIFEPHAILCSDYWLINLLMINNFNVNKMCWGHTWYIGADFQLYAIFLGILILSVKFPQYKKIIYTSIGIVGIALPSIMSHIKKLDAMPSVRPETFRHMYWKNIETAEVLYLSTYSNLTGFFVGIICGELYFKYLKQDKYKRFVANILESAPLYGLLVISVIWSLGSKLFFEEHTIWTALYPLLHKHLTVAIVAIIVILRNMSRIGGFLAWPIFRVIARISYQIYLWHLLIMFMIYGSYTEPMNVSFLFLLKLLGTTYILAVIASFFIALMVDYPFAQIVDIFDLKRKSKTFQETSIDCDTNKVDS